MLFSLFLFRPSKPRIKFGPNCINQRADSARLRLYEVNVFGIANSGREEQFI